MRAVTYTRKGPAREVLSIEDIELPAPGPGEVRVRLAFSGVNPSDVKSRGGVTAPRMDFERIVPHSDGAGVVDAIGDGVPPERLGQRVWVFNGQWARPLGTAAEAIVLPASQAVPLPDGVPLEVGASIGIPLMTAWHAVDACGSLLGRTVVVTGAAGSVGAYAAQLARLAGATVIGTVSSDEKARLAAGLGVHHVVNYRAQPVGAAVRGLTGGRGADALIEVDAAANGAEWGEMLGFGGKAVVYGAGQRTVDLPFRPLISNFTTVYFFIVYRLQGEALRRTLAGIGDLLQRGALRHPALAVYPLADAAEAHERVERGADAKVLLKL
jgi:NADPH2:quinone reductase